MKLLEKRVVSPTNSNLQPVPTQDTPANELLQLAVNNAVGQESNKVISDVDYVADILGVIRTEARAEPNVVPQYAEVRSSRWNKDLFARIANVLAVAQNNETKVAPQRVREYIGMIVSSSSFQLGVISNQMRMSRVPTPMVGQELDEEQQKYAELQDYLREVNRSYGYAQIFVEPDRPTKYIPGRPPKPRSTDRMVESAPIIAKNAK